MNDENGMKRKIIQENKIKRKVQRKGTCRKINTQRIREERIQRNVQKQKYKQNGSRKEKIKEFQKTKGRQN